MARFRDTARAPEMIEIERGYFLMGSRTAVASIYVDETPARECSVDRPLAVGTYPITFGEFRHFLHDIAPDLPTMAFIEKAGAIASRLPMVGVSWHEAGHYCEWLTEITHQRYRLLSELEWEYVCRAGTETAYWWGDTFDKSKANCRPEDAPRVMPQGFDDIVSTLGFLTPVDRYAPNPWGLADLHGNVWEWVQDIYDDRRSAPSGFASRGGVEPYRSLRGGSWMDPPLSLRSAARSWAYPTARDRNISFRVARDL